MKLKELYEIFSPIQNIILVSYSDINDLQTPYYGTEIVYQGSLENFYKSKYFKTGFWGEKEISVICCSRKIGYLNIYVK